MTASRTSSRLPTSRWSRAAQRGVTAIHASEALRRYVVAVCEATRNDSRVELGASPRAGLMLFRAAKALAAVEGRDHALPDDVQALAPAVLAHRLALAPGRHLGQRDRSRGRGARARPGAMTVRGHTPQRALTA